MNRLKKVLLSVCCMGAITIGWSAYVQAAPVSMRLGGADRYETAVKVSQDSWQQSDNVVLVSGENFPDALCAAPLAKKYNAPILLTSSKTLNDSVLSEIKRLQAKNIFIIGGTGVISQDIQDQLTKLNLQCTRIQGNDRYGTSVEVARKIGTDNGIVLASGENFPDALSIASIASAKQMPIILTTGMALPDSIKLFVSDNSSNKFYAVGGKGVIDDSIVNSLTNCKRLSGSSRYETNLAVLNEFSDSIDFTNVYVATGEGFADALGGSAAAAKNSSAIVLTDSKYVAAQYLVQAHSDKMMAVKALGGAAVISDSIIDKLMSNQAFSPKTVLGYAIKSDVSYNSMMQSAKILDEVATVGLDSDGDGTLATGAISTKEVDYSNKNGVKPLLLVTNSFSIDATKTLLENPDKRQNLINNIMNALKTNNYRGVNIDFENVYGSDRDYLTTFMKELYGTLHPSGYLVTMSVPAKTSDDPTSNWSGAYDFAALGNYADQIAIMAYDFSYSGGDPGPIAPINWVQKVVDYALTQLPPEKILLGVEDYARDWTVKDDDPTKTAGAIYCKSYGVDDAYATAAKYGVIVNWEDAFKCPIFRYTDENGKKHEVWFENAASISYKLDLVNNKNLAGIAIWRMGFENQDYMNAIKLKFNKFSDKQVSN